MANVKKYKKIYLLSFLILGFLLLYLSSILPQATERFYSDIAFKAISQVLSTITGVIPLSLAEIIIIAAAIIILWRIISLIKNFIRTPGMRTKIVKSFLANILIAVSLIYISFLILWGLNYNRIPFSTIASMEIKPASVKELAEVCNDLIQTSNRLRSSVAEDDKGVMKLAAGIDDALKKAPEGYERASNVYSQLGGIYGRPKRVLLSPLMSYTGITGFYFPFTAEANVNTAVPDSTIPFTACHESAHQRGFAREDEANYIAYLTCSMHPDVDFQYSGAMMALIYTMNTMYEYDHNQYEKLSRLYSDGVRRDLIYINKYWSRYEGPVQEISNRINDTYLQANMQKDGVYSYGRMVDLLIAQYRKNGGLIK